MNRNFLIFEKLISTILILYGCIVLYSTILMIETLTDIAHSQNIANDDFIFLRISKIYFLDILEGALTIFGGIFLLFGKKVGWIVSLIASLLNGILLLYAVIEAYSLNNESAFLISARILMMTLFFTMAFCLTLYPFRTKYSILIKT